MSKRYILFSIIILIVIAIPVLVYKSQDLRRSFKSEVTNELKNFKTADNSILTENDIADLPQPIQKYLRYTGVIGKEKVRNLRSVWEGQFKPDRKKGWVKAKAEQYNFFENTKRIYFMNLKMFGVPVIGLHVYKNATATMRIKFAGLLKVADARGEIMNKAETVTVFNDMCLLAPASLIDKRIVWETINPLKVKATFNNNGIKISAELFFNDKGEMVNFISNDRYITSTGKDYQNAPWSTPVGDYKDYDGIRLASYGEAHWSLPEGDYCYGKLHLKEIDYNITSFR